MAELSALRLLVAATSIIISAAVLRALYILSGAALRSGPTGPKSDASHMLVVLGSGGHTAEMMSLLRDINPRRYRHRTYIVSSGDSFSSSKAEEIESLIQLKYTNKSTSPQTDLGTWDLKVVPRARKIHQSLYTTPFSALWCLFQCLRILHETSRIAAFEYPDVIITNGPATAVIVILAANLLKFFGFAPLWKMKTIYVESWARVKTLSLSGSFCYGLEFVTDS